MTKRRLDNHQECLREFGERFRRNAIENLEFWNTQNPELGAARSGAYALVLRDLRDAAASAGVPLQDIGIEDLDFPLPS